MRGRPGQPEFGMWRTRTLACCSASASSVPGVPSVEPSSTKISSNSSAGRLWASSESTHSPNTAPGLNTGTTTLTLTTARIIRAGMG